MPRSVFSLFWKVPGDSRHWLSTLKVINLLNLHHLSSNSLRLRKYNFFSLAVIDIVTIVINVVVALNFATALKIFTDLWICLVLKNEDWLSGYRIHWTRLSKINNQGEIIKEIIHIYYISYTHIIIYLHLTSLFILCGTSPAAVLLFIVNRSFRNNSVQLFWQYKKKFSCCYFFEFRYFALSVFKENFLV